MNILICDDDKEIVEAISIYLKQEGYQVICAYDGQEALDITKKQEIHLIILDIMMPKLDGIHALLKLREKVQSRLFYFPQNRRMRIRFWV